MTEANAWADVLVVGAGLSGLMAAQTLREHGLSVLLLDKGRSPGGRLATRRIGPGRADHGAQFFTVRTPQFQAWVDRWLALGLVYPWATGWSDGSLAQPAGAGHPRYAVHGGMNALAKEFSQGLEVRVDTHLVSLSVGPGGWQAMARTGQWYHGGALLLTPPVPQGLALLDSGSVSLAGDQRTALERIDYAPCLAGLFLLDRPPQLPEPGALQRPGHVFPWIADNRRKGISPGAIVVTVHAGPQASRERWDASEAEALSWLRAGLAPFLVAGTEILESQLKRWRYALPTKLYPERALMVTSLPAPLAFAGDAFGGPRVEGTALSGMAAGHALAARWIRNVEDPWAGWI